MAWTSCGVVQERDKSKAFVGGRLFWVGGIGLRVVRGGGTVMLCGLDSGISTGLRCCSGGSWVC